MSHSRIFSQSYPNQKLILENTHAMEMSKQIINHRQRLLVLDGNLI
jgi:hypothetical protein